METENCKLCKNMFYYNNYKIKIQCGHIFCKECIVKHLLINKFVCPIDKSHNIVDKTNLPFFSFNEVLLTQNKEKDDFNSYTSVFDLTKTKQKSEKNKISNELNINSIIISNSQQKDFLCFLKSLFSTRILIIEKIFQASKHNFSSFEFHKQCDSISSLLLICKTKKTGYVFGGYTSKNWESNIIGSYKNDDYSFLYSYTFKTKHKLFRNKENSLLIDKNYGPSFGGGCDLKISNLNEENSSNLGFSYFFNDDYNTINSKCYLAGEENFELEEYEIFNIDFHVY